VYGLNSYFNARSYGANYINYPNINPNPSSVTRFGASHIGMNVTNQFQNGVNMLSRIEYSPDLYLYSLRLSSAYFERYLVLNISFLFMII
jgi:hypothetical protein